MIFDCPNCQQSLEIDDSWAGEAIDCPSCRQSITVPAATPELPSAPRPPMHVPLQPRAATGLPKRKKRGAGCAGFFLFLIVLAAGAFGYAMYRFQESPQRVWQRAKDYAQTFLQPSPTEEPAPVEEQPTISPTSPPDPLVWIVEHKDYWPGEVALREPLEFPAVSNGKTVGSTKVPAGVTVKVIALANNQITADYLGGRREIPIAATDLADRAKIALAKAQADEKRASVSTKSSLPKTQPEKSETIREATREEISSGLGAQYTRAATTFRLFAPTAKSVSVVFYDEASGEAGRKARALRHGNNGIWDETIRGDLRGKFYTYLLDERDPKNSREVVDPYATNTVASSKRARVTPLTLPVPRGPRLASPTDAIIYEMQVRDFTIDANSGVQNAGLYLGWTEEGTTLPDDENIKTALDHLVELGVTHVELMPVQDFDNDESSRAYNWGYITSNFFSPEGMFATNPNDQSRVRELKALIAALHARGIGVIMDVVYNHAAANSSLRSIAPEVYYRRNPDGSLANGSGCGNEVASENPMTRRLILDSLKYWTRDYGIDGFRFDLMALIDQETMREAERELRQINPDIVLFGEPWTGGTSPLRAKTDKTALHQVPVGAFNDDFRNALKGQPDGSEPGWIQDGSNRGALTAALRISNWFASPAQSINYMTCHDNLVLWDKLMLSMPNADDALRIDAMKLGYLVLFTAQGVPFLHGGEEFARSKGGNNNSYEASDAVNEVDWVLKRQHLDLFKYVRDLIALRKQHPMFRLRTRAEVASRLQFLPTSNNKTLLFTLNGEGVAGEKWKRICVMLNSADTDAEMIPSGSGWSLAVDEHGAIASPVSVSSKITVPRKSGVVLFQQ